VDCTASKGTTTGNEFDTRHLKSAAVKESSDPKSSRNGAASTVTSGTMLTGTSRQGFDSVRPPLTKFQLVAALTAMKPR
jgi:hypothetical protein